MKLNDEELVLIKGGELKITSALLTSVSKVIDALMEVGRSLGTTIRMMYSNRSC